MEDAANNCCVVTALRNCGCGSAPHLKSWLTSTMAFKVFSSFIAFGSGTDFGFTSLLMGMLPVVYGKKS